NRYYLNGVVDNRHPFTLSIRARVLQEEGSTTGFQVNVIRGGEFLFGLSPSKIYGLGPLPTVINATQFHDYRMEGIPHVGYNLFVDDVPIASLKPGLGANIPYHLA